MTRYSRSEPITPKVRNPLSGKPEAELSAGMVAGRSSRSGRVIAMRWGTYRRTPSGCTRWLHPTVAERLP